MNNVFVVALVALIAGAGGAWLFGQVAGGESGAGGVEGSDDASLLREQVADLTREIERLKNPPATLGVDAPAGARAGAASEQAVVDAVLAKLDERVDARVKTRFEELAAEEGTSGEGERRGRRGSRRKRVNLEDAARELELSAAEEDELRRIYKDSMDRMLKLAAGEDGDVEAVKRDLEEARKNPMAGRGLMMKYLPKIMNNMGEMLSITTEREAAVVKAVGPDKARRLNSEFDVIEANPIGGGFRIGASVESEVPGGGR